MCPQPDRTVERASERATISAAFGLSLEVDPAIDIPGLSPAVSSGPGDVPTRVRLDPAELEQRWRSSGEPRRMRELRDGESLVLTVDLAEPAGYLLQADGVGRVLISPAGTELLCDPLPDCPDWAFILPAQALPLAATLREREVFHAAGVVVAGGALLFSGAPGAGKTSLAAAFARRGAALLDDDAVALENRDGSLVAHSGVGTLYLRAAEHDRLSEDERDLLGTPFPLAGRLRYTPKATIASAPLAGLFLLERSEVGAAVERIEDVDPFDLLAATFNLSVRTPERLTRQLDVVAALVAGRCIYRLRIHSDMDATQLADGVRQHLASVPR